MKFPTLDSRSSIQAPARVASGALTGAGLSSNRKLEIQNRKFPKAFSLVEVLAAIAIIGVITFLAIPNIVRIKEDGEQSLAIARAEALNMATASYVQANGSAAATSGWSGAADNQARYTLLTPYMAFAPTQISTYMPGGYSATLPSTLIPLTKVSLAGASGTIAY